LGCPHPWRLRLTMLPPTTSRRVDASVDTVCGIRLPVMASHALASIELVCRFTTAARSLSVQIVIPKDAVLADEAEAVYEAIRREAKRLCRKARSMGLLDAAAAGGRPLSWPTCIQQLSLQELVSAHLEGWCPHLEICHAEVQQQHERWPSDRVHILFSRDLPWQPEAGPECSDRRVGARHVVAEASVQKKALGGQVEVSLPWDQLSRLHTRLASLEEELERERCTSSTLQSSLRRANSLLEVLAHSVSEEHRARSDLEAALQAQFEVLVRAAIDREASLGDIVEECESLITAMTQNGRASPDAGSKGVDWLRAAETAILAQICEQFEPKHLSLLRRISTDHAAQGLSQGVPDPQSYQSDRLLKELAACLQSAALATNEVPRVSTPVPVPVPAMRELQLPRSRGRLADAGGGGSAREWAGDRGGGGGGPNRHLLPAISQTISGSQTARTAHAPQRAAQSPVVGNEAVSRQSFEPSSGQSSGAVDLPSASGREDAIATRHRTNARGNYAAGLLKRVSDTGNPISASAQAAKGTRLEVAALESTESKLSAIRQNFALLTSILAGLCANSEGYSASRPGTQGQASCAYGEPHGPQRTSTSPVVGSSSIDSSAALSRRQACQYHEMCDDSDQDAESGHKGGVYDKHKN